MRESPPPKDFTACGTFLISFRVALLIAFRIFAAHGPLPLLRCFSKFARVNRISFGFSRAPELLFTTTPFSSSRHFPPIALNAGMRAGFAPRESAPPAAAGFGIVARSLPLLVRRPERRGREELVSVKVCCDRCV